MTATITLSCPEGIVLAADRKITYSDPNGNILDIEPKPVSKIYQFSKVNVGASCWGLYFGGDLGGSTILDHLYTFETATVEQNDDVNTLAKKLKSSLETQFPKMEKKMGIHLAGYCRNNDETFPQIRHVFHEKWNKPGEYVNENSNQEYHRLGDGKKQVYPYDPFIAVFNGDYTIANLFFNFLPNIYPKRKRRIILDRLSLDECIQLAHLIVATSGTILNFLTELDGKIESPEVQGLMIAKITKKNGFLWVKKG